MQGAWPGELARILKPGGTLYATFHGPFIFRKFFDEYPQDAKMSHFTRGFFFVKNIGDGVLPEWYQTALQTERGFLGAVPPGLERLFYAPQGHCSFQDAIALRRV
jgi:hypothetical protein